MLCTCNLVHNLQEFNLSIGNLPWQFRGMTLDPTLSVFASSSGIFRCSGPPPLQMRKATNVLSTSQMLQFICPAVQEVYLRKVDASYLRTPQFWQKTPWKLFAGRCKLGLLSARVRSLKWIEHVREKNSLPCQENLFIKVYEHIM